MKKLFAFAVRLARDAKENNLITHANELTYKLLLSFFPFLIFLMSLLAFLKMDVGPYLDDMARALPEGIGGILESFATEVLSKRSAGILSGSLLVTLYTTSSGLNALIRGINKAYGERETRGFIAVRLISVALVFLLAAAIILSLVILIFGDAIYNALLKNYAVSPAMGFVFGAAGYLAVMAILLFAVIFIYKFAACRKITVTGAFPGALVTLVVWVVSSKALNIYVNNFARYSRVYGSIAGIIILMLWLNIISVILLIGGAVNAAIVIERDRK